MRARSHLLVLSLLALAGVSSTSAHALSFPTDTTLILGGDPTLLAPLPQPISGTQSLPPFVSPGAVSASGRYVAFASNVPALGIPADVASGIVVRNTLTGATVLASRASDGSAMPNASGPSISADGRRVAFSSLPTGGMTQVWVRDLGDATTPPTTTLVSANTSGAAGNGASGSASISADGTRVAFASTASDLTPDDTDANGDVFVRDLRPGGTTSLVSAVPPGTSKRNVLSVSLSGDGRHVAFSSDTNGIVSGDANGKVDVFVRDLSVNPPVTRLASVANDGSGAAANAASARATISADGSRVAFASSATNLATDPGSPQLPQPSQVWVHDFTDGSTVLASRGDGAGPAADKAAGAPQLSADGHVVAFNSAATNLVAAVTGGTAEIYRRDLVHGTTSLVSRQQGATGTAATNGSAASAVTADGACVLFTAEQILLGPSGLVGAGGLGVYLRTFATDCGRGPGAPDSGGGNGNGGGGGAGGSGSTGGGAKVTPAPDTTPPLLSGVALSHTRFRVAKTHTPLAARTVPRGTLLRFVASEDGRLSIAVERARPGRKAQQRGKLVCTAVRRPVKRGGCTSYARVATLQRTIRAGRGSVALSGRIGAKRMAPGTYRLTLTARDAAGNASKATLRTFTILAG